MVLILGTLGNFIKKYTFFVTTYKCNTKILFIGIILAIERILLLARNCEQINKIYYTQRRQKSIMHVMG